VRAPPIATDEPLPLGPDDRLHNSGYGPPPERYRTPAIGSRFTLDYMALLRAWPNARPADARELRGVEPRDERVPADLVARYACALARALGASVRAAARDDVHAALVVLAGVVRKRGLCDGIVLTARPDDLDEKTAGKAKSRLRGAVLPASDEQVAVALITVVSCTPPLVLWGREPSLAMLRPDRVLSVARLRQSGASPQADRVWRQLHVRGKGGSA
jgi:hypothetical protein